MRELGEWLGRVEAPAELSERVLGHGFMAIEPERAESRLRSRSWAFVAGPLVALAMLAVVLIDGRGWLNRPLESGDPAAVRAWVQSKAGIRVPLPDKLAPAVRLVSASRTENDTTRIAFQVNGQEAILLISMASAAVAGDGRHRFLSRTETSASWTMRGVVYTVLCPSGQVAQVACQLCHSL